MPNTPNVNVKLLNIWQKQMLLAPCRFSRNVNKFSKQRFHAAEDLRRKQAYELLGVISSIDKVSAR